MGQVRQPSHVQRRFLRSSRPVSTPPAEATAVREESVEQQPLWGRSAADSGPAATWGRPTSGAGGIPAAGLHQAGNWGRPPLAGNGIPPSNVMSPASSRFDRAASKPDDHDLLPHERRARDLMLEKSAKDQQRPVRKPFGPGPQITRAGRYEPRSQEEKIELAKRDIGRRQAMESHYGGNRYQEGPRISRHVIGSDASNLIRDKDLDGSGWNQLRKRGVIAAEGPTRPKPRETSFADSRAEREEQARSSGYIPISSRPILRSAFSRDGSQNSAFVDAMETRGGGSRTPGVSGSWQERQPSLEQSKKPSNAWGSSIASRRLDLSAPLPERPSSVNQLGAREESRGDRITEKQPSQVQSRAKEASLEKQAPASQITADRTEDAKDPVVTWSPFSGIQEASKKKEVASEEQEDHEEREVRRKKTRTRRGAATESTYDDLPKGKDRDKAKRRQQFARKNQEDEAAEEEANARAEAKQQRKKERAAQKAAKAAGATPIFLPEYISVANLAVALKVKLEEFVRKMENLGFEETNHDYILSAENAGLIAMEYNYDPIIERSESEDLKARDPAPDPSILPQRPPVVTIMGHVDHGKTTILDYLRKSSVAATEHGGITQHIGAFSVPMPSGKIITFLDTPGHAAFLSMRQRGANVTDIVILVVAADDSVKPQTIEAINHAKAARVPIIVAINKIDKPDRDIDRVKQDLARHGVDVEDFGGDTQVVCVSGKTGQGMPDLEEAAVTLSEILDMRADIDGPAEGWVLEASIKSMGKVATVLVRRGTMRPGDFIVAGKTWARIRCLRNEAGVEVLEAGPGTPIEIDGWREQPLAGDEVLQAPDEAKAKSVVNYRLEKEERDKMAEDMEAINENRKVEQERRERDKAEAIAVAEAEAADEQAPEKQKLKASGPKQVYFIIKGDVSGSVEAVIDSIMALGNSEVQPHILRSGVGQLSEFDIEYAAAAKGHVISFNTEIEPNISRLAEDAKVGILDHNIIYRLVDDVKAELSKYLPPLITQRVLGEAEIAQIFQINIKGRQYKSIAGCKVRNGTISKTAKVRVLRSGEKVYDGKLFH